MYNQPNRAWKSHLAALREDYELGEVEDKKVFEEVLLNATPETASECLKIIGPALSAKFDHWFVMRFGDTIPKRKEPIRDPFDFIYGPRYDRNIFWKRICLPIVDMYRGLDPRYRGHSVDDRTLEAFHRLVLNRRESV